MIDTLSRRVEQLSTRPVPPPAPPNGDVDVAPEFNPGTGAGAGAGSAGGGGAAMPAAPVGPGTGDDTGAGDEVSAGGSAGPSPTAAQPSSRFNMPAPIPSLRAETRFGPGFEIRTPDDEYSFQFHNLTQFDYRGYEDTPHANIINDRFQSTFGFPRQWWIFSGRLTKPFEYFVVPAFGFDNVNLLDAFLNVNLDSRLQFKIGRYKTPFTYEFYSEPINGLISPERSLFFNNFGLNRDCGLMAWGQLFDKRLDYAAGIFNGDRNFFIDRNSSKDFAGLMNVRPFGAREGSILENFNIGGSVLFGNEFNIPVPRTLRTNVATTGASFFGVPFLGFNNNVIESGDRALWDLHAAWYYRHLSLIAEWGSGFQDYAFSATPGDRTRLPVSGYYVQAGYFLTGETVSNRGMLKPLSDFDISHGRFGTGAVELTSRWSTLNLGSEVFTRGLADPNLWTRDAQLLDLGVNWYWTQYIKLYLGWQHAMFGNPVFLEPGRFQLTNDMYWVRFQVYF
jgi:phosphate-selective porin OprO/OprP